MSSNVKTAVIISGGGMLTAYNAGVISELRKYIQPDLIIAGSGGSALAAFYASGQLNDQIEKDAWTKYLATRKMIHPWRFLRIFDTDYLIDVIKHKLPLDVERIRTSHINLEITALSEKTGEIVYFNKHHNIFDVIQASHAVPVMAKSINIDGEYYVDSFASSHVYNHIERAFEVYGMDKVLVVNCIPFVGRYLSLEFWLYRLFRSLGFYRNLKSDMDRLRFNHKRFKQGLTASNDILFIEPSRDTRITPFTVNPRGLWRAFKIGKYDAESLKEHIQEFLERQVSTTA